MSNVWYYEYSIKIWDDVDSKEEMRCGVIPAESMGEAIEDLEEYYGEILDVQVLKAITDGTVFDFKYVMEDTDFDYVINKKM